MARERAFLPECWTRDGSQNRCSHSADGVRQIVTHASCTQFIQKNIAWNDPLYLRCRSTQHRSGTAPIEPAVSQVDGNRRNVVSLHKRALSGYAVGDGVCPTEGKTDILP